MRKYRSTALEIVAISQQLLEGLHVLHEKGLAPRDLKPENVMVSTGGELKILDLGVARRVPLAVTNSSFDEGAWSQTLGFGVGTPGYMAPEQWRGDEIDTRADIFAVGVIAYELIVGHSPFRGATNHEVRDVTLRGEPSFDGPEWTSAPPTLKDTVRKALSRDPEQRFATAKSMLEALGPLSRPAHSSVSVRRTPTVRSLRDEGGRRESLAGRKEATTARHR